MVPGKAQGGLTCRSHRADATPPGVLAGAGR